MAVTINTNFYQADEWKDLSKIVFTSPNMDSPANAGTRSHILPGQSNLGLWYEDSTNMYRIESEQLLVQSDYYNYTMDVSDTIDLSTAPEYVSVNNVSSSVFIDDVLQQVGVIPNGYQDYTTRITDSTVRLEYVPLSQDLEYIFSSGDYYTVSDVLSNYSYCYPAASEGYRSRVLEKRQVGWYTEVISSIPECYITFTFDYPVCITKFSMEGVRQYIETYLQLNCPYSSIPGSIDLSSTTNTNYFVGSYKIQQSEDNDAWTDIYTGSVTNSITQQAYIDNSVYCLYYRIALLNNTSITYSDVDKNYYGINNLKFYGYSYPENVSDDTNVDLYKFDGLSAPDILKIKNVSLIDGSAETITTVSGTHAVAGTVNTTTVSGAEYYSEYYISLQTTSADYITNALCTATTISGTGTDAINEGYTSTTRAVVDNNIPADIEATVIYPTPTSISFTSSGTITKDCSTSTSVCSEDISYITVASGTVVPGEAIHTISGYTERVSTTTSSDRSVGCKLWLSSENTCSGTLTEGDTLSYWGHVGSSENLDMEVNNSVLFELTFGEAYDCRLTAWDDVTHSTTTNELIADDHVRVSSVAYKATNGKLDPQNGDNYIFPPSHNRIFKGDLTVGDYNYFYGDFDMVYRYQEDVFGDYLMFKPMLYGVTDALSYGIHDFVITLSYSYT